MITFIDNGEEITLIGVGDKRQIVGEEDIVTYLHDGDAVMKMRDTLEGREYSLSYVGNFEDGKPVWQDFIIWE